MWGSKRPHSVRGDNSHRQRYMHDLETDPLNCSLCGEICPGGGVCVAGQCNSCLGLAQLTCNGACTNGATDPNNCGGCGNACPLGECTSGTCPGIICMDPNTPNFCNGNQCVDLLTDRNNCSGCGMVCPAGQTCQQGQCAPPPGPCEGDPLTPDQCGSICSDLQTDSNNCGSCGTVCPSGSSCSEGLCSPPGGSGPWVCDGEFTDILTDPDNCGGCGDVCPSGSDCESGQCEPGPTTCGDPNTPSSCSSGCTNLQTDPSNCGSCGNACPNGQQCNQGQCAAIPTATPTPNYSPLGTYFLSGFASGFGYSTTVSGIMQAGSSGFFTGSVDAGSSTPCPGCPDFSGGYTCGGGGSSDPYIVCTSVGFGYQGVGDVITFEPSETCDFELPSCSGMLGVANGDVGWQFGIADLTQ